MRRPVRIFAAALLAVAALSPGRAHAADLLIQDFAGGVCTTNNLGGPAGDGATMAAVSCANGVLESTWNATTDYWYTQLTPGTSGYNLSSYDYLSFDFAGSTSALTLTLRLMRGSGVTVAKRLNSWSPEALPSGLTRLDVPISDYFTVAQSTAVREVRFLTFYPAAGWMQLDNIYARKESELKVVSAEMRNNKTLRVEFNVPVGAGATTAGNYSLSPSVSVTGAALYDNNRTVQLTLASALAVNTAYTLTVNGVSGQNGAALGSNNTATFMGHGAVCVLTDDFNRSGQALLDNDRPVALWPSGGTALDVGNWLALSTTTKLYGNASFLSMDGSSLKKQAQIMYDASPIAMNNVYYRLYFYAPSSFFNVAAEKYQSIANIDDTTYTYGMTAYLLNHAGQPAMYMELNNVPGTWPGSPYIPVVPDQWNTLEMYLSTPTAATQVKVWLNGNRVWDHVDDFSGLTAWQHVYLGLGFDSPTNSANVFQRGLYFDEVRVSSLNYVGPIEKPDMVYASATGPDTVKVYFDRAVSPDEAQWLDPATYSFYPPLTVNSAVIEDDFRTVSLNTSLQTNATGYTLSVNPSYLAAGAPNSANFIGLNPAQYLVDDFNRPNNSVLTTDYPKGVWDSLVNSGVNSVAISTGMSFRSKASLKLDDSSLTASYAQLTKTVNISSYAYVRMYAYFDENFFTGMTNGQVHSIFEMDGSNAACHSGNTLPCGLILYAYKAAAGDYRLAMEFHDTNDTWPGNYSTSITTGAWNCVEVLVPSTGTAAVGKLYVNGALTAQTTADISDAGYWSLLSMGLGWASSASFQHTLYLDEVIVSTTGYVGPIPDYTSACGLKYYDGAAAVPLACEKPENLNSQLRVYKAPYTYGVVLTDVDDPNASKIRVNTANGPRAVRKY